MNLDSSQTEFEAIVPGAVEAYKTLKSSDGMGIYTSSGKFFNHTLFGRDASMSAKFVTDFDHQIVRETITALAALQGTQFNKVTQEEPGRIHHEFRDFSTWRGTWTSRLLLQFFKWKWGAKDGVLLTYFSVDSTASYVRLINKYAHRIDRSILAKKVVNQHDETITVEESLALAADWLMQQIDKNNHFAPQRTNKWSLPFQIYEDSPTSYVRQNHRLLNFERPIAYGSAQVFASDALEDATKLLSHHPQRHAWQEAAHKLRDSFMTDFWQADKQYFSSAIDANGPSELDSVSIGWTLNNSLWNEISASERQQKISAIVRRLFSDGFVTKVGLRTRAIDLPQPLDGVLEYHDADAVWPMFNFMVIEGLRRHELYRLAHQLENRLLNGVNAIGQFPEFINVDRAGNVIKPVTSGAKKTVKAQMKPEERIAFTVVPCLTLARRIVENRRHKPLTKGWQVQLEDEILSQIEQIERAEPAQSKEVIGKIVPAKFNRLTGNLKTSYYFIREYSKLS